MESAPESKIKWIDKSGNIMVKEVHIEIGKYKSSHYKCGENISSVYRHDNRLIYCEMNNNDHKNKIIELLQKMKKFHKKYGKF
jgi:hypothetical protein